jgi:crotonobetainyl-CoA:carnitine CoA-transferase CaiB-like acyl-CoA transferase
MSALEGVKVICVGQFYFAPYCSMLLARLGADVIKIEAPEGDPYRRLASADDDGTSVQFTMLNSGKRAMRLDLKEEAGQEILRSLAAQADVLIQNLSPGAMERFGLGYDVLHEVNPRLIMASGTGFGSFGPYAGQPAMDLTIQARTAIMSTTGFMDGPPVRTGPSVVDFMAGAHLVGGVLAALYQREHTGVGQRRGRASGRDPAVALVEHRRPRQLARDDAGAHWQSPRWACGRPLQRLQDERRVGDGPVPHAGTLGTAGRRHG